MKNKIVSILAVTLMFIMAFAIVGCSNDDDSQITGDLLTEIELVSSKEIAKIGETVDFEVAIFPKTSGYIMYAMYGSLYSVSLKQCTIEMVLSNNTAGATITKISDKKYAVSSAKIGSVEVSAQIKINNSEIPSDEKNIAASQNKSKTIQLYFYDKLITTADELKAIGETSSGLKGNYLLGNDIDVSANNWSPIGNESTPFMGYFDGGGNTISGIKINSLLQSGSGFFGALSGTVKNLNVNVEIVASYAGGIAGISKGVITDCEVRGRIEKANAEYVGGIVGKQTDGNINNNENYANVTGANYVGGIAAYQYLADESFLIKDCTNYGQISGISNIGGIFGYIYGYNTGSSGVGEDTYSSILSCTNNGTVTGAGDSVGGIIGYGLGKSYNDYAHYIAVNACENTAKISGNDMVGGIVGNAGANFGAVEYCENNGDIAGNDYIGGYVGKGDRLTLKGLVNNNTIGANAYAGGIIGAGGKITLCENNGQINAMGVRSPESGTGIVVACVGGIAGYSLFVSDCKNTANITYNGIGAYVGGLAGWIYYEGPSNMTNNANSGNITSSTGAGGIFGYLVLHLSRISLENFSNSGFVIGNYRVGGVIGQLNCSTTSGFSTATQVIACTNSGTVIGSHYVGGIVGEAIGGVGTNFLGQTVTQHWITFSSCENDGAVNGSDFIGGILGMRKGNINNPISCENRGVISGPATNKYEIMAAQSQAIG